MNYLQVFEKLEEMLNNAKKIPLTSIALLPEEKVLNMAHLLHKNYPEEMKLSSIIINQKNELLEEARQSALEIVEDAKRERDRLTSQQEIYRQALSKSENLKKEVKNELIGILREMNEVLVNHTKNYRQQFVKIEQEIENSYRKAVDKFQDIKDHLIDTI